MEEDIFVIQWIKLKLNFALTALLELMEVAPPIFLNKSNLKYLTPIAAPEDLEFQAKNITIPFLSQKFDLVPTVGYLRVRDDGKVEGFCAGPAETSVGLEENHGNVNVPTSLSLKVAYKIWLPSWELHRASGLVSTSSRKSS